MPGIGFPRGHKNDIIEMKKRKYIEEENIPTTPLWEKLLFALAIAAIVALIAFALDFDFYQTYE